MKQILLALGLSIITTSAFAQTPRAKPFIRVPQITGDVAADTKANLGLNAPDTNSTSPSSVCNFNLLAALKADTLLKQIQACIQTKLFDDVEASLNSATAAQDKPGMACLAPALEIVRAAKGTAAVAAVPATDTTPAIAAVDAINPGPILLFQKFREFELAGGPAACKTWVNSTVAGANPLTQ